MAVTEKQRHDLMMELVPPVGWADVATKHDLEVLRREMATKEDLHQLRRDLATWLFSAVAVQTAVFGLLLAVTR